MSKSKEEEHPLDMNELERGVLYHVNQARRYLRKGKFAPAKCSLLTACCLVEDDLLIRIKLFRIFMMEKPFQTFKAQSCFEELFLSRLDTNKNRNENNTFRDFFIEEMRIFLVEIREKWGHYLPDSDFIRIFGRDDDHKYHDSYVSLWITIEPQKRMRLLERFLEYHPKEIRLQYAIHLFVINEFKDHNVVTWCMRWIDLMKKFRRSVEKNVQFALLVHETYIQVVLPILVNSDDYYEKLGPNDIIMKDHIIDAFHCLFFDYFANENDIYPPISPNSLPLDNRSNVTTRRIVLLKLLNILVAIDEHKRWNIFNREDFEFTREPGFFNQTYGKWKEFYVQQSDGKWSNCSVGFFVRKLSSFIEESFKKENNAFDLSAKQSDDYFKIVSYSILFFLMLFDLYEVNIQHKTIYEKSPMTCNEDHSTVIKSTRHIRPMMGQPREFVGDDPKTDRHLINCIEALLEFDASIDFIRKEFDIFASKIEMDKNFSYFRFKICRALREEDYKTGLSLMINFQPHILSSNDGNDLCWPRDACQTFRLLQYHLEMLTFTDRCEDYHTSVNLIFRATMILYSDVINQTVQFNDYQLVPVDVLNPFVMYSKFALLLPTAYPCLCISSSGGNSNADDELNLDSASFFFNKNPIVLRGTTADTVVGRLVDSCIYLLSKLEVDLHVGYLIVLYQYRWPFYYHQFENCMRILRQNLTPKSHAQNVVTVDQNQLSTVVMPDPTQGLCNKPPFIFPPFKDYIYEYDILEQFKKLADEYDFLCQIEPGVYRTDNVQITAGLLETMMKRPPYPEDVFVILNFLGAKIIPLLQANLQAGARSRESN